MSPARFATTSPNLARRFALLASGRVRPNPPRASSSSPSSSTRRGLISGRRMPSAAPPVTVASTRVANYAIGSRLVSDSPSVSDATPIQFILHADWVTCTQ